MMAGTGWKWIFGALTLLLSPAPLQAAGDAEAGRQLFTGACQSCHGPEGEGDGAAAAGFPLRPRPFSSAAFKFDTDADWQTGTDADLAGVIRNGAAAYGGSAAMAAWPALSDEEIADLVAFIRSRGPERLAPVLAGGGGFAPVYELLGRHCGACHVRGVADGPWSLDTPPGADRFPVCLERPEAEQLGCATFHELVDAPGPGIPAWVQPGDPAASSPYLQACDPSVSFHIGHSLSAALPEPDCAAIRSWIEAGAAQF